MVNLLPGAIALKCPPDAPLPSLDLINPENRLDPGDAALRNWFKSGMASQDIVLPVSAGQGGYLRTLERVAPLRFPADVAGTCTQDLVRMGLDPNRWFCTLHGRETDKAASRSKFMRDALPGTFQELTRHVIERLGGQVVRLGHPGMSSFTPANGLLDLSVIPDSSLLQTFAISRSRFFYGSPSGPSAVADAFLVPSAITSALDYVTCNDNLLIRTVDLVTPDDRLLRQRQLFEEGFESLQIVEALLSNTGYQMSKNALPEMIRLANFIYDMTADQTGWRDPAPSPIGPRPNQFVWPPGPPLERGIFLPV